MFHLNRSKTLLNPSYFKSSTNLLKERPIKHCLSLIEPKFWNQSFQPNSPKSTKLTPPYSYPLSSNQFHSPKFLFPASLSMAATQNRFYSSNSENWTEIMNKAQLKTKKIFHSLDPQINYFYESMEKTVFFGGSVLAWLVMPAVFRKVHKYTSKNRIMALLGGQAKEVPYERSIWNCLEAPVEYFAIFIILSQIGAFFSPSMLPYLPQIYRGSAVIALVWFLHRWKTSALSGSVAADGSPPGSFDQERLSALDKVSSLGLITIGIMGLAEASGVAVNSLLTVWGLGGVATTFAAKEVLGNILSGFSLQLSKPFCVGDIIKAGSVEGQVVAIGLTSTSLLDTKKFTYIYVPNSQISSEAIVHKPNRLSSVIKIPVRIEDLEKIPAISAEIKEALKANPKVLDFPYCYLSRLENSFHDFHGRVRYPIYDET